MTNEKLLLLYREAIAAIADLQVKLGLSEKRRIEMANTVKIARKHIMAAIEAAPCELEYPRYTLTSSLYRPAKGGGSQGVRVIWTIK